MTSLRVDAGATWVRLHLFKNGRRIGALRRPSAPIFGLDKTVRRVMRIWKLAKVDELIVGAKGAWNKAERQALKRRLRPLAHRIKIMSDAELLWQDQFGEGPGLLVIAGTGSIALASTGTRRLQRAGGLGPLLGDEGSAFWIGREGLRRLPRLFGKTRARGLAPLWQIRPVEAVREIAALSRRVIKHARRDKEARAICIEAAQALAGLANEARNLAGLKTPANLAVSGGLFEDPFFKKIFLAALGAGFHLLK